MTTPSEPRAVCTSQGTWTSGERKVGSMASGSSAPMSGPGNTNREVADGAFGEISHFWGAAETTWPAATANGAAAPAFALVPAAVNWAAREGKPGAAVATRVAAVPRVAEGADVCPAR